VKSEPETQMAAAAVGRDHVRTSRAEREQVIEVLKAAFVQGRLTMDEFEERIGQALTSRTYAELAAVTADVPTGLTLASPPHSRPARRRVQVRMNTAVTGGACVILAAHVGMAAALLSGSWVAVVLMVVFIIVASTVSIGAMLVAR
jgi:Domain of unknown function (DUF1707)